ncbi:putative glycoside hydrolase family 79 protein [Neofusicoccum parvum UCRNP2]|uniref:Putative glycoside hydrolase family 79 protein n=1 Tax=Botryosphaeria parva (strain UCR-NP2) TaxID=1287680 RepID=R1FZ65_BOTPV|nr:putative glycoside hydrolase family 79 protein [Neofusicoccum parvum UCRNP2]
MRLATTTPTLLATTALAQTITLSAPPTLNSTARRIDGAFQSFSIEFAYMADYFGNLTAPNKLSHALLSHLSALAGGTAHPALRAGGSTANRAAYNASQPVAVVNTFGGNPDQPSAVSVGPACQGIVPELRKNLLNHTNVIDRVWPHQQMSPVVVSQGIEAIGGNGNTKQVRSIVEAETFVAYALYGETRLDSLIVVNMEPFNATTSGPRPYVTVQVPSAPGKGSGSGTRKSVMKDGSLSGDEMVEIVQPGEQIKLQNSEAILIKI